MCICGVTVGTPFRNEGVTSIFAAAPGGGTDDRAASEATTLMDGLARGPLPLSVKYLRKTVSEISALELTILLGREVRTTWDLFHRVSEAAKKVFSRSELMMQFLALLRDLGSAFAGGHGRSLDLALCAYLCPRHLVTLVPSGTR